MIQRYGLFGAYDDWNMEPDSDGEYVLFSEHVAEVERLRAEVARLREALEPFAEAAEECDDYGFDDMNQAPVDAGQCREARAALQDRPAPTDGGKG